MKHLKPLATRLAMSAAASVLLAGAAHAAGTTAGTTVENTFTLNYSVGAVGQDPITNDGNPGNDDPTAFSVDRIVNLTMTGGDTTNQEVAPGETGIEFTYTVTNTGNDLQSYSLALFDQSDAPISGAADDFDSTFTVTYSVTPTAALDLDDSGTVGDSDCEALTAFSGTIGTFTTLAAASAAAANITCPIAPDDSVTFTITTSTASTLSDDEEDEFFIAVETREPLEWLINTTLALADEITNPTSGDVMDATPSNNDPDAVENVFLDAAVDSADVAEDGVASQPDGLVINSPDLSAEKFAVVQASPTEATPTPTCTGTAADLPLSTTEAAGVFPIPGACVAYIIEVTNGSQEATNTASITSLVDSLPAEVTYVTSAHNLTTGTLVAEDTNDGNSACDGDAAETCRVTLGPATLAGTNAADSIAQLVIWATVK